MIRPANIEDIEAILKLGKELHQSSTYSSMEFDSDKVRQLMSGLIEGAGVVFVAVVDGEIVGGIAGGVAEYWFNREIHGFDFSFFISEEKRTGSLAMRLLFALENWCKSRGAVEMRIGITTGINVNGTTRFYNFMGYENTGPLFTKDLKNGD